MSPEPKHSGHRDKAGRPTRETNTTRPPESTTEVGHDDLTEPTPHTSPCSLAATSCGIGPPTSRSFVRRALHLDPAGPIPSISGGYEETRWPQSPRLLVGGDVPSTACDGCGSCGAGGICGTVRPGCGNGRRSFPAWRERRRVRTGEWRPQQLRTQAQCTAQYFYLFGQLAPADLGVFHERRSVKGPRE